MAGETCNHPSIHRSTISNFRSTKGIFRAQVSSFPVQGFEGGAPSLPPTTRTCRPTARTTGTAPSASVYARPLVRVPSAPRSATRPRWRPCLQKRTSSGLKLRPTVDSQRRNGRAAARQQRRVRHPPPRPRSTNTRGRRPRTTSSRCRRHMQRHSDARTHSRSIGKTQKATRGCDSYSCSSRLLFRGTESRAIRNGPCLHMPATSVAVVACAGEARRINRPRLHHRSRQLGTRR